MDSNGLSLRKLATVLGVSQPFLSQIRAGKRPLPEALRTKVEALGAYHLLIGDKRAEGPTGDEGAGQTPIVGTDTMVEVRGIEPLTPCLQSSGAGWNNWRQSSAISRRYWCHIPVGSPPVNPRGKPTRPESTLLRP